MTSLLAFLVTYWKVTLGVALYVALLVKVGWFRHANWWAICHLARALVPEKDRYTRDGKLDRHRTYSPAQRAAIIRRDGNRCQCHGCGGRDCCHGQAVDGQPGVRLECDHRHPYARGGRTNLANGQMLCGPCNRSKGARVHDDERWAA